VVVDPISNFLAAGSTIEAGTMLVRLIDLLKAQQMTTLFTNLVGGGNEPEQTDIGISSIIDTWLLLRTSEQSNERSSFLYILKSRGMPHSRSIRSYRLTDQGIELLDQNVRQPGRRSLS
jgi:circadian clock protein KaiC